MYRLRMTIASVLFLSVGAHANEKQDPVYQPAPQAIKQEQGQVQQQGQGQQQEQQATGGNSQANGTQNLGVSYKYEQAASSPYAPPVYASGSCAYGWSVGVSSPVGGIAGGKAKPDEACDRRELARVMSPLNPELAIKLLCADPMYVAILIEGECVYKPIPDNTKPMVVILEDDKTGLATTEQLDRAFKASQGK